MKKITLMLLILPIMAQAQQIKLYPKIAVSYGNDKIRIIDDYGYRCDYHIPKFMFRTGLEARYKKLSIYYDTKIWCANSGRRFSPEQSIFEVGVNYQITDKIKINASHTCRHPLSTDNGKFHDGIYGGGDVISISYGY